MLNLDCDRTKVSTRAVVVRTVWQVINKQKRREKLWNKRRDEKKEEKENYFGNNGVKGMI